VDYPKRLIEVDLPIKRISAHARREKSIRHGHISTLHIWWARRPLAACRAVICAALWPDPADEKCPQAFREEARRLMTAWAKNHLDLTSPESMSRFNRVKNDSKVLADNVELRKALLDFIADYSNWDNSNKPEYLACCRSMTSAAHQSLFATTSKPLVADSFAGGGAIPVEALRVGADAFATDLNPLPVLLNRVVLQYIPIHGTTLAHELRRLGGRVKANVEKVLTKYYPPEEDSSIPIAYLWARTVRCEGPNCGYTVPLFRSPIIARTARRTVGLRLSDDSRQKVVRAEPLQKTASGWQSIDGTQFPRSAVGSTGTVQRGSATCPHCGYTTPVTRVREQLQGRRGGANDCQLLTTVTIRKNESGRFYRPPSVEDLRAFSAARSVPTPPRSTTNGEPSPIPDELISLNELRRISIPLYGMASWGDVFNARQALFLHTVVAAIRETVSQCPEAIRQPLTVLLALALGRQTDSCSTLTRWHTTREISTGTFGRQALGMVWDYCEVNPFSGASGGWDNAVEWIAKVCESHANALSETTGNVVAASATAHPLPDNSVAAWITDPPYYDAVPYAHLSDFFYVWLRRVLYDCDPTLFAEPCAPKDQEIVVDRPHSRSKSKKDVAFYEEHLTQAFAEGRRIVDPGGVGVIVFASKTTASWEAILNAVIQAGWTITGSWPIDTEMEARVAAQGQSRLASSVHLVCRARENPDGTLRVTAVGDWRAVLAELPACIHEWMPRLAREGVVGADAIFACLGPALEIFSRYSNVEKASGEIVTLREYLEQVWAAVSTEALSMIFRDADAAGLESDARFTAIVLWTLGTGGSSSGESADEETEAGDDDGDDDDEEDTPRGKVANGGYTLEYDAARKIAQGLGVNLEQINSVVEVKGDKARLLPVSERAATLFGKAEKAEAATKTRGKKATQKKLFDNDAEEGAGKTETVTLGDGAAATPGVTALDRVHQAMLLFGNGRADALKRFIVEDGVGGDARFWKLAQSLSALYPPGSDEKRWVDGVLARKKSFGF
jgi:putative DNA methylase